MRLFEIERPVLYICAHAAQGIGAVVTLDEPCFWLSTEMENAIEAGRPAGCHSRSLTIPLATIPCGAQFTYVVEPIGRLERQNVGWLRRLQDTDFDQVGVVAHYVNGYWSGRDCPEERGAPWEFRAVKAKIIRRIGGSAKSSALLS